MRTPSILLAACLLLPGVGCGGATSGNRATSTQNRPSTSAVTSGVQRPSENIEHDLASAGAGRVFVLTGPNADIVDAPVETANRWTTTSTRVAWRVAGPAVRGFVPVLLTPTPEVSRLPGGCSSDPVVRTLLPLEISGYISLASLEQALREDVVRGSAGRRIRARAGTAVLAGERTVQLIDGRLDIQLAAEDASDLSFGWSYTCPAGGCSRTLPGTVPQSGCTVASREGSFDFGFARAIARGATLRRVGEGRVARLTSRCLEVEYAVPATAEPLACSGASAAPTDEEPAAAGPRFYPTNLDFGGASYLHPDEPARGRIRFVGDPEVSEGLYIEDVRDGVLAGGEAVLACYEESLLMEADLSGFMTLAFTVGSGGRVTAARIEDSTIAQPSLTRCIESAVRSLQFVPPENVTSVTVRYPLMLWPPPMTMRIAPGTELFNMNGNRVGRVLEETSVGLDEEHSNANRNCFAVPLAGPVHAATPLFVCLPQTASR